MPSPKFISAVLVAAFVIHAPLNELRAAPGEEASGPGELSQPASAPNSKQIMSDLTGHYFFGGAAQLGAGPDPYDSLESTAIRSSVRKGDVLEYRVSSLLFEASSRENPLEVDSIVTYGMEGDRWALLTVQTERTRNMNGRDSKASDDSC